MIRASVLIALAACTAAPSDAPSDDDITGPYTGMRHRFVVDGFS